MGVPAAVQTNIITFLGHERVVLCTHSRTVVVRSGHQCGPLTTHHSPLTTHEDGQVHGHGGRGACQSLDRVPACPCPVSIDDATSTTYLRELYPDGPALSTPPRHVPGGQASWRLQATLLVVVVVAVLIHSRHRPRNVLIPSLPGPPPEIP